MSPAENLISAQFKIKKGKVLYVEGLYVLTTVLAVSIGLVIVNVIKPGSYISEQTRTELVSSYTADANSKIEAANKQSEVGPLQSLFVIVPDNIIKILKFYKFYNKLLIL